MIISAKTRSLFIQAWSENGQSPARKFKAAEVIADATAAAYARLFTRVKRIKDRPTPRAMASTILKTAVAVGFAQVPDAALGMLEREIQVPKALGPI